MFNIMKNKCSNPTKFHLKKLKTALRIKCNMSKKIQASHEHALLFRIVKAT